MRDNRVYHKNSLGVLQNWVPRDDPLMSFNYTAYTGVVGAAATKFMLA